MKKRLLIGLLAAAMLLAMTACAGDPEESSADEISQGESTSDSAESAETGEDETSVDAESTEDEVSSDVAGDSTTAGSVANATTTKGKSSTTKGKTSTTKSKTTETVGTVAPDANKDYVPAMKLSNKTVRLLTHNDTHEKYRAYAKEAYDIDLQVETVAYSDVTLKFVSYRLSNDAPDLVINGFTPAANNAGYYEPLEDKIQWKHALWNDSSVYDHNMNQRWKGHLYQVSTVVNHYGYVFFNKDMFDEAGLDYPSDLYKKGTWTWDKMLEYAEELTLDPQNTGTPTQYGLGIGEAEILLYTTGKHFIGTDSKGMAVNNMLSTEIARYMTFHDKLAKSGTLYTGSLSSREGFGIGQIAMELGFYWYASGYRKLIKSDSLGLAPLPKDPSADKYYTPVDGDGWSIATGCKNPDGAVAVLNAIRWAGMDPAFGEANLKESYDKGRWTPELEEMRLLNNGPSGVPMLWAAFNVHNYWGEIWNRVGTSEPWSTVAQSIAPAVDYEIQKLYDAELEVEE